MATSKPTGDDANLPFAALQLLAPPVRLVSAAVWKVMEQRHVLEYGVVEEFMTSACETVPGLLTVRHQGRLALGLRARLILELCINQPDVTVVEHHLRRIRAPDSSSSAPTAMKDVKVIKAAKKFESLVQSLLTNRSKREQFFKDEFPVEYGPVFDQELEKLLWEFLIRLDQLLPVPNLAQTVSWLSDAPSILAQCARAATQPQLLKIVLQHQSRLGHPEPAESLRPNMEDSILDSLSLPLSGQVALNESTETTKLPVDQSDGAQTTDNLPFIAPVIGLISNEDVPVMISASRKTVASINATNVFTEPKENLQFTMVKEKQISKDNDGKKVVEELQKRTNSPKINLQGKCKHPDQSLIESYEEEHEVLGKARSDKNSTSRKSQTTSDLTKNKIKETEAPSGKSEAVLETCMSQLGIKTLHLPEDPWLRSIYLSCLHNQPRVVIEKLSAAHQTGRIQKQQDGRRQSHKPMCSKRRKSDSRLPDLDDKENHPVLAGISSSPSQQLNNAESQVLPGDDEDYVADSEDEVTKNFKGRLFMKRYYRTKHGTYVPTLREFWKPAKTRRGLLSASSKRR